MNVQAEVTANCTLTIVTVARNDVWALVKTMRSVFEQTSRDFEYVVVDGASTDGSQRLIEFWRRQGLVTRAVSEPDRSVYEAMNKGLQMARGDYVLFLNAGDVFAGADLVEQVLGVLSDGILDGILGWGELNDQIWASWAEHEAFTMSSLGFCHQALFVRRSLLLDEPFDDRPFKTDSDTLQLGRLYGAGARIAIMPEVLAVRGGEPGISANLERTAISIRTTLIEEYPGLSGTEADRIIAFRRRCEEVEAVLALLSKPDQRLAGHLARMVLDTLFQRQSAKLASGTVAKLTDAAFAVILAEPDGAQDIRRLNLAQTRRAEQLGLRRDRVKDRDRAVSKFAGEEDQRITKARQTKLSGASAPSSDFVVSLTSFPARLKTVAFAIQSLFEQTCPPAEIHLWLGRDEVPGVNWLPKRLRDLEQRGLKVHFAPRTFHQYDKFMHNAALNADKPFVIVDDDVIYPPISMQRLLEASALHPGAVVANRCNLMTLEADGRPAPYKSWRREVRSPEPSLLLFPTGAGGVMYPPGFMTDPLVTDADEILLHAPYADDIWLKACALIRDIPSFATSLSHKADWYHRYTPGMEQGALMSTNVERGLNDTQLVASLAMVDRIRPGWWRRPSPAGVIA